MGFADLLAQADRLARKQLGEPITYTPNIGDAVTVDGVFDEVFVRVGTPDAGQAGVSSSGPAVFLTLSELPSDPKSDRLAVVTRVKNGKIYSAHEVDPDGTGGVVMHLHEVT
jgi:hypothetical protein